MNTLKKSSGHRYCGLTDDPMTRKAAHGHPGDWELVPMQFADEGSARTWEKLELMTPRTCGGPGGKGWRYGYRYTVTATTIED